MKRMSLAGLVDPPGSKALLEFLGRTFQLKIQPWVALGGESRNEAGNEKLKRSIARINTELHGKEDKKRWG